jgi:hypothetical protein
MALSTFNYFDQVKKVKFETLPVALKKSHELVQKVGTGADAWANYHGSAQIKSMVDSYFGLMDKVLDKHPEWHVAAPKPAAAPKAPKAPKAAAAPKAPKTVKATKAPASKFEEIGYYNAKGEPVNGRVNPDKLYYLQPDGSYIKGGDGRGPGYVKKPKKQRAKKTKPADTRDEVPHLDGDVVFMQKFLKLVDKPATLQQVKNLHSNLEKSVTKQLVRSTSPYADDLDEIARLVAKTYEHMLEKEIGSFDELEFNSPVVGRARTVVAGVRVATATKLLSSFINMQGTVPSERSVELLKKKLQNEYAEHPEGDFALAIGAAEAVLRDWQPGKIVRITKQQLSGLSGLGCPDSPGKPCGCGPKKARR